MSGAKKQERYGLLDSLRGLCLLSMIGYHGAYDLLHIVGLPISWLHDTPGYLWQQSICWGFIFLSGFCWSLSRRPLRHGLLLTACGGAITLITYFIMPSELIQYGVLTLLGLSALLLTLLTEVGNRLKLHIPPAIGLGVSLLLFFLLRGLPQGYLGFEGLRLCSLPGGLYQTDWAALLGFHSPAFYSTDYFPLLPWFFLYTAGFFLWKLLSRRKEALDFLRPGFAPLSFLGRHSLLIYLLHQPVLLGCFLLLGRG